MFDIKYQQLALFGLAGLLLASCSGGLRVSNSPPVKSHRTVILFLVDGLSSGALKRNLESGEAPQLKNFFLRGKKGFSLGRAAFPTLTYPNLSSILTADRVGEQPVISNHVKFGDKVVNFESAAQHARLRKEIDPLSVFAKLNSAGRETASFSYVLGLNASDHMEFGLKEGLDYEGHDFESLDDQLISNLEDFLADRADPATWPDFIYVHLVGVDGTAHEFGPNSREAKRYLGWLDKRLKKVFQLLARAEKRKEVVSILTADHGFVETNTFVDLEKTLRKIDKRIVVTNESRFLGLHFPPGLAPGAVARLLENLAQVKGVELTAWKRENSLELGMPGRRIAFDYGPAVCASETYSLAVHAEGTQNASLGYRCPDQFDSGRYPFLVAGLSRFLNAPNHPDALVVAKPNVSFTKGARGSHGGPTAEEVLVPVLLRNASFRGNEIQPTSDLLKLLEQI